MACAYSKCLNAIAYSTAQVPCVAVVENMSYFEADGKRYFPFGQGSGGCRTCCPLPSCKGGARPNCRLTTSTSAGCAAVCTASFVHSELPHSGALSWCQLNCICSSPLNIFPTPPGERIQKEFGLPNLVRFPIVPDLSAAGDTGKPVVVEVSAGRCKLIGSWDDCL